MTYKLSKELIETLDNVDRQESGYIFHAITDKTKK